MNASAPGHPAAGPTMNRLMPRVALASFVGALLEWYDFYIFATASALVFGRLFFPDGNPVVGTMAAFGAFASGFLARPIGGVIFGHIGDRLGRRASLVVTLAVIGLGTFIIGLLPTWHDVGIVSPILLVTLRVIQGIGLGGEYGGAALLTIEHAPEHERGFWGSLPQAASPAGLLLASAVFSLTSLMPHESFMAWGWRLPFLFSIVMLAVGMMIRLHVTETPAFEAVRIALGPRAPLLVLWDESRDSTLFAIGARLAETANGNMIKSFGLTYATLRLGLSQQVALDALLATSVAALAATPIFGWLSDRVGYREVYACGAALTALMAFPFFWVLDLRTPSAVWIAFIVAYTFGPTLMLSVQPTFFTGLFAPRVRYTGLSIAYQVSAILGGFVPLIALSLLRATNGRPWPIAAFLLATALLSLLCTLRARTAAS